MVSRFLFLAALMMMFVACGDDEDKVPVDNPLVGEWLSSTRTYSECNDTDINETITFQVTPCMEGDASGCAYQKISFSETIMTSDYRDVFFGGFFEDVSDTNYSIDGNAMSLCDGEDCDRYTFSIDGDMLEFVGDKESDGCIEVWRLTRI